MLRGLPSVPITRAVAALAVTATLAFVVAGCGGGASPQEKWADNVCTHLGNWQDQLNKTVADVSSQLESPGPGTRAAIKTDIQNALNATQTLVQNLKGIGAPSGESGAQAKQQIDALASKLQAKANTVRQNAEKVPQNASLSDVVQRLAALAPAIQSAAQTTSNALREIETKSSALKDGIQKANSCDRFR
jgi:chromosome segregation ATPase